MAFPSGFPESSRNRILLRLLRAPWRVLGLVLLVVFAVEATVMLSLPWFLPEDFDETWAAVVDAALLTLFCSPVLWWIIIRPLRKIALEAQALSSTIVESAGDGIITVDAKGLILSYNRAAQSLFGFRADTILGQSVLELLPDFQLRSTEVGSPESVVGRRFEGRNFPASVSARSLGDDVTAGFVVVVRDLTEAQRAEAARTAAARQQEALRAQQMATLAQLATGVAHEIRNPLTAIKMLVQTSADVGDRAALEGEDLKIVEDQIRRMERSVNALLDFARPAPAERRRITLTDLLPDVVRLLEGQARKQNVQLSIVEGSAEATIDADSAQLQQLFLNLGLNALSVMPEGGRLTFKLTNPSDKTICAQVIDTGPGIDPQLIDDIFKPFVTTRQQGVGLGLNVCERIASSHSGTLTACNRRSGGAIFQLCLPLAREPESSPTESESRHAASARN